MFGYTASMPTERPSYDDRPERAGRKGITAYLPEDFAKRLKLFSVEKDLTMQEIVETALREWIERNDKRSAAPSSSRIAKRG